jgi:outer membrane protein assembly factor BamA
MVRVECANQPIFFSGNDGFIKLDLRNQWFWPLGSNVGKNGILALKVHLGIAKPTNKSNKDIPRFERFFAGSSSGFRGTKPDALGPKVKDESGDCAVNAIPSCDTPTGGQGLILINVDYSFPCFSQIVWGEVFVDSGQVYRKLSRYSNMHLPGFRTAFGLGLIFKIGIPIKMEYATNINYIVRRHKNRKETKDNQFLFSAGYQF